MLSLRYDNGGDDEDDDACDSDAEMMIAYSHSPFFYLSSHKGAQQIS